MLSCASMSSSVGEHQEGILSHEQKHRCAAVLNPLQPPNMHEYVIFNISLVLELGSVLLLRLGEKNSNSQQEVEPNDDKDGQ